jgi:group I intron endonuclease
MKISGIYKIQSISRPERIYIGSAVNINRRWAIHLSTLKHFKHHSVKLQRHYNKYGIADLLFTILLGCNKEDLIKTEQYFLDSYKPYFNNNKIAGSNLGYKFSLEARRKMSESRKGKNCGKIPWIKGKTLSARTRQKMSESQRGEKNSFFGKHHTSEIKKKISDIQKQIKIGDKNPFYGKRHSEETRKKMSESRKGKNNSFYGKHHTEESKLKNRLAHLKNCG